MSETNTQEPVVASLGGTQRIQTDNPVVLEEQANANNSNEGAAQTEEEKDKAIAELDKSKLPELNDEQLKELLKGRGIEFDNFDTLKEKLKAPAEVAAEPTAEEKQKAASDFEKRQLDLFISSGGKVEEFAAIKNVLAMDLKELSIQDIRKEAKDAGLTEEQTDAIIQERYYQKNPDELEQGEDEEDNDFEARKKEYKAKHDYATKKIEKRGQNIKKNAESILKNLTTALQQSDLSKREIEESEKAIASKTDDIFSKIPKKITFELGKGTDGADIAPVLYDVDDADIESVKSLLKDPTQRNNFLYTPEGELNVEAIAAMSVENANLKKALKVAYLEGGSRQVEAFRKVFPNHTAQSLGLNGNAQQNTATAGKGKPASFGKSQRS
jgi:hypothetical protein